ncbi:MAG TPA: hypothetical protein VL123_05130 [Candidatus Udaeobacter sp.]|jgi:CheY-like chemotaxis protein|nr:hypothetical protein [Candidatus Udaeobacter sp.]
MTETPDSRANPANRRAILVAVPDLFFLTRIRAVAEASRATVVECEPPALAERVREARPDLVILDLHAPGDPLAAVRSLKSDPILASVPVVGFYSHVDQELRLLAQSAGVDFVLPRSAFTAKLPALIQGGRLESPR